MQRTSFTLLVALVPFAGGWSSCDTSLTNDPSFDRWCGEHLCEWRTDEGTDRKVPTWHEDDHGVELVGSPAQISQLLPEGGFFDTPRCVRFEAMTDIDSGASVTLGLDFLDDGKVEFQTPLAATHWESVSFLLSMPDHFPSVRFILRKTGAGRAVLAHLRVVATDGCTDPPIVFTDRPAGVPCAIDSECASGRCGERLLPPGTACGDCNRPGDCTMGEVCGVVVSGIGLHAGCKPAGQALLGERCLHDSECSSSICCGQVCSACCIPEHPCPGGESCSGRSLGELLPPSTCSLAGPGSPCLGDSDCQSGRCVGAGSLSVCGNFDGRRCTSNSDCPETSGPLGPVAGRCLWIGVLDGRCQ